MMGMGSFDRDDDRADELEVGPAQEATLAFDEDGESLPWLESDDEEVDEGVDGRRILAFVVGGLALLGLIIGGIWMISHRRSDPGLLPEGSTIAAPDEPYKVKPEEPGGRTFEGTGDTSFAVGEGREREGRIAAPTPPPPAVKAAPDGTAPAPVPASSGGVAVQVGAYSTRESAEAGWSKLATTHEALKGFSHRVVEGKADIGTVYRLQAVAGDRAAGNQLCSTLKAQGAACQVK